MRNIHQQTRCIFLLHLCIVLALSSIGPRSSMAQDSTEVDSEDGTAPEEDGYKEYLKGIYMEEEGDYPGAFLQFRRANEMTPGDAEVLKAMARTGLQVGRIREAREALDEVKELDLMDHEAHLLSAKTNYLLGRRNMLLRDLEKARELEPRDLETLDFLARVYTQNEEYERAIGVLEDLRKVESDDPEIPYRLGFLLTQLDRTDEAVDAFEEALELAPDSPDAALALGAIYEAKEDESKAIEVYKQVLEKDQGNPRAIERLIHIYYRNEDYKEAVKLLEPMYDGGHLDYELSFMLAELHYRMEDYGSADAVLLAMLERFGKRVEIYRMLGDVSARSGEVDKAEEYFNRAIEIDPNDYASYLSLFFVSSGYFSEKEEREYSSRSRLLLVQAAALVEPQDFRGQFLIGVAYKDLDSLSTAEEYLNRAVDLRPESREALFNLGLALEAQKKYKICEERMLSYLERNPEDPVILNFYGYLLADQGIKLDEAEKRIKRALKHDPKNGYYVDSLGWVFYQRGKYRQALKELKKANDLVEDDPTILEHIGDTYRAMERFREALSAYRKAAAIEPDDHEVQEKIRSMEEELDH